MRWLLLCALGCGGDSVLSALAPPVAEVVVRVADKQVAESEPIVVEVEAIYAAGWEVEAGQPSAEGLELSLLDQEGPVLTGERHRVRWRYALSGPPGSYVIATAPSQGMGPGDQTRTFEPSPIFVDIGVDGPSGGPMSDFELSPVPEAPPWGWIAAGAAAALALVALVVWRMRKSKVLPPPPLIPPHIRAVQDWDAAFLLGRQGELDDSGLALELSRVLRAYLEAICAWPATARTTREIMDFLEREGAGLVHLDVADRMRTARILDATDRLKFAREGGGKTFFDALDDDFHAVIAATRPSDLSEVPLD